MDSVSEAAPLAAGRPWPLGAHWDGHGVNFALFSEHADRVVLRVFADGGVARDYPLIHCTDQVWHGYLPGAQPGLRYAYRVDGPAAPGNRFDPTHLLLDPYARAFRVPPANGSAAASHAGWQACVTDDHFDWQGDAPPAIPLARSVLYEVHVKGATQAHPGVPEALRGTYAGLATPAMIAHFKRLGVTAIKLLPVHAFLDEGHLLTAGLKNYWGYNSFAFFAPEPRYAAGLGGQSVAAEFRSMVRALHAAGLEVILDVVFNHTAEGDENGPTTSFRGIDNASYYRLSADDPARYVNYSGCGNTLNLAHPRVLQLVMDSLRYWVDEMHVDGFRFDLAATLTRDSGFLAAIAQDPCLARAKLIAEPWDLGPGGYRLGGFTPGWSEWNDRFRDDVRAFWLTGEVGVNTLAQRLLGSSEIFRQRGRSPLAGVNFITAHDGFTLRDLVSYREKRNDANGEGNRDGNNHNLSCHCGVEGESSDPKVVECRRLLRRALLATLFVAQGVPMLQGGDEIGRSQAGNNNAYCQDNPTTWFDWVRADNELADFTTGLIALRRRFPQLTSGRWLTGEENAEGRRDALWWHPDGHEMGRKDWDSAKSAGLGLLLAPLPSASERRMLLVLFNRNAVPMDFSLPQGDWQQLCDSASRTPFAPATLRSGCRLAAHSVRLLAREPRLTRP